MSGSQGSPLRSGSLPALVAVVLAASALARGGPDEDQRQKTPRDRPAAGSPADTDRPPTPDAESAALAFVRENHPELAELLLQLKPMRPTEYDRAVRELAQVSRNLAALRARNPRAYELGLDVWKARSRVELLTARLAGAPGPDPELEGQLRRAVAAQLDSEIRQQAFERDRVEERLRKLRENLDRLESRRDSIIESRYQASVKKGQRARQRNRPQAAAGTKAKPKAAVQGRVKIESDRADPVATTTKGGRQP